MDEHNEITLRKRMAIIKGAIASIKMQIDNEKFGNILDSGTHQPDNIDVATVKTLNEKLEFAKTMLAQDEAKLAILLGNKTSSL